MPGHVRAALDKRDLLEAFRARPRYQQDDYLKWLALAVGEAAKKARLAQFLDELAAGDKFKGEPWSPPPPVARATSPDAG
ncbi:MAG: YdeI/OmpD-associated family protein [Kofleriaceae bacterium]|jgi:uncharacterized protein YdeI (YjbR/CyaY-like superfamily)|nr:YdeI/OmpD-associated family protein [Kofleriaceae bacterium]MBP6837425.1 YdeI/OmpD-associated family protein [Kofleriaceae bacterium]MBP9207938.1 YdeI/OmpD-associated family protein [Kofleriaceae bacterium]